MLARHPGGLSPRPLPGGTANRGLVVRVGDTVRRPTAPCWPATHALLAHLAKVGFDGAPRVLAADATIETLTYIDGQAAVPPLAEDTLTDAALVSVADLLRRYHLAASSFDPAGYSWPRPIPARFRTGLVSHNDAHPANLVFRDGRAVALIDFDWAGPGSAIQRPDMGNWAGFRQTIPFYNGRLRILGKLRGHSKVLLQQDRGLREGMRSKRTRRRFETPVQGVEF